MAIQNGNSFSIEITEKEIDGMDSEEISRFAAKGMLALNREVKDLKSKVEVVTLNVASLYGSVNKLGEEIDKTRIQQDYDKVDNEVKFNEFDKKIKDGKDEINKRVTELVDRPKTIASKVISYSKDLLYIVLAILVLWSRVVK